MKMNRILQIIILLVSVSLTNVIFGQQDPHYTQYMFNTMSVNPAYAGSKGHSVLNLLSRTQWVGVDGAPKTQNLSFDTPLGYSGVGLGVNLVHDAIGPARETYIDANASYTVRSSYEGNLAFGLKLGGRLFNVNWERGIYRDKGDKQLSEPINKFLPTIGAGIYYYKSNWYVGLAVPNIIRSDHYDDVLAGGSVATERMHYFFIAGYVFDLNESIMFKPALLTKAVHGAPLSIDISANFLFNGRFRAGIGWRWDDSISALVGFQVNRFFQIGYAYDLTTSNYTNYTSGTHEVMLRFELSEGLSMKSPRFF